MTRSIALALTLAIAAAAAPAAQTLTADQQQELRRRIEARFDVVPLTDAVGLRPRSPVRDVRLIEIAPDGSIAVNGVPVTGRELRDRIGNDADAVLRLSYLDAAARRSLFSTATPPATTPAEPVETASPPLEREPPPRETRSRRASGDRVRIFGDVAVDENESLGGQAVAVLGSVRVDGEVGDQVVAVLGSVTLGPKAIVRGDVVSVGGRVNRAPGAQIRGNVTEVSLTDARGPVHVDWPGVVWWPGYVFPGFGPAERLIGTGLRLMLMFLLAALAFVIARPTVESAAYRIAEAPVQATFVGIAAEVLIPPILLISTIVLILIVVGIPLLLLLPFLVLALLVMALFGYAGVAYAIGGWLRRRTATGGGGMLDVFVGIIAIMLPLLLGRVIALVGWAAGPLAFALVVIGVMLEFLAWTAGFGAVLVNAFSRWQARRAARVPVAPPAGM